jgi:CRP/FNR family transcriptional regulator, dissimilatory nitrate respiration regulator
MMIDFKILLKNDLFQHIGLDELEANFELDSCIIGHYKKGSLIIQENDPCKSIGFVLSGALAMQSLSPKGEALTIQLFSTNDCFGPALLYLQKPIYPFSLVTTQDSTILYISFEQITDFIRRNSEFNINFIRYLSNRINVFKYKIQLLHLKDVRSKLVFYLSVEYKQLGEVSFKLRHTQVEIADFIDVARPSVSREFKKMMADQLIILNGHQITLLQPEVFCLNS